MVNRTTTKYAQRNKFDQNSVNVFMYACYSRNYEMAKYLLVQQQLLSEKYEPFNVNNGVMEILCYNNDLFMIEWLFNYQKTLNQIDPLKYPLLDINHDDDLPFIIACGRGNLEIAVWLYNNSQVDLLSKNEMALGMVCVNNKPDIFKWLVNECKKKYGNDPQKIEYLRDRIRNYIDVCRMMHGECANIMYGYYLTETEFKNITYWDLVSCGMIILERSK